MVKKKDSRTPATVKKQDEYIGQLVLLTQEKAPCSKSCKDCKCKVKVVTRSSSCLHQIIRSLVGDLVD